MTTKSMVSVADVASAIHIIRGHRVLFDADLATVYGVTVKALNQAVRRHRERFPSDFMLVVTREEVASLRSQVVTLKPRRGAHRKYLPHAFTEQGVAMLSSVLRSSRAVRVNIEIMRAFVRLRAWAISHADLAARLDELEKKYDHQFRVVFDELRQATTEPARESQRIGFREEEG